MRVSKFNFYLTILKNSCFLINVFLKKFKAKLLLCLAFTYIFWSGKTGSLKKFILSKKISHFTVIGSSLLVKTQFTVFVNYETLFFFTFIFAIIDILQLNIIREGVDSVQNSAVKTQAFLEKQFNTSMIKTDSTSLSI